MMKQLYDKHRDEYLHFERVENKTSQRADLHAFNLLDRLIPGSGDIVGSAEHDEIWLSISPDELTKVATEDQIVELIRCGVRYDSYNDALSMFV
jgi:hypothetical protein